MRRDIYAGDIEEIAGIQGEMAEWTKAHDSKSCGPKGPGGSNPSLSVSQWRLAKKLWRQPRLSSF